MTFETDRILSDSELGVDQLLLVKEMGFLPTSVVDQFLLVKEAVSTYKQITSLIDKNDSPHYDQLGHFVDKMYVCPANSPLRSQSLVRLLANFVYTYMYFVLIQ